MKNNKYKYTEIINDALKGISDFTSGNVIIGDPIITPNGSTVIPVSKVTVGLLSGMGEYGEIKLFSSNKDYPKSNAGGGVVSVKPFGFLIEKGKSVKFVSTPDDYMDKTLNAVVDFLEARNEKI